MSEGEKREGEKREGEKEEKSRSKQWPASLRPPPRVAHTSTPGPKSSKFFSYCKKATRNMQQMANDQARIQNREHSLHVAHLNFGAKNLINDHVPRYWND